jgi:hypothetical protein
VAVLRAVVFVIAACIASPAAAQTPQQAPAGTGTISGKVTTGDTGKPIAGAVMHLIRWEGGRGAQSYGRTDDQGQFVFDKLLPGSYQLSAAADRYVGLDFGQKIPTEPGRRIELADGQSFTQADFTLPRTSAISGRLTDEFGDPVPNVAVQIARVTYAAGKTRLLPIGSPNAVRPTDDLGQFRAFNLPPGDYYVLALSGPFAGADNASGFAPTFYPGTRVATQAQAVHVDFGQDLSNVSFALAPAPMGTLAGSVVDGTSQPVAGADVMLLQTTGGDVRTMIMARMAADSAGAFAFRNVPAGSYVIQAFGRPQGGGNLGRAPFGSLALDVPEGGIRDRVVTIGGATLRGRIVFDGTAPLPPPSAVSVFPAPVEFVSSPIGGGPPAQVTHDDWTFEVSNMSGLRAVRVNIGSPAWVLKRVMLGGQDITDQAVDFRKGDVDGVEITLTTSVSTITGTVTDKGAPATGFGVIVFAEDPAKWTFPSRYLAVASGQPQGQFRASGLPPGAYRAVAVPSGETVAAQDPAYLTSLLPYASTVLLGEGETKAVSLTLVKR